MIHTYTAASYYFLHEQRQTTTYYTDKREIVAKSTLNKSRGYCTVSIYKGLEIAICEDMQQCDVADFIAQNVLDPELYRNLNWAVFRSPIDKMKEKEVLRINLPEAYALEYYETGHVLKDRFSSIENAAYEMNLSITEVRRMTYNKMTTKRNRLKPYFLVVKR